MATMISGDTHTVRHALLHSALVLLDDHGPDALQTRKVAAAAGTSTMALYTHFGGMRTLIAEVATEARRQFNEVLTMAESDDPVADLLVYGAAYRAFAIRRPHLYRLMFGSTSAHGINAPSRDVLSLTSTEITHQHPTFAHVVRSVRRAVEAGRITVRPIGADHAVVEVAAQFWTMTHGFVMLELAGYFGTDGTSINTVMGALAANTLLALGDSPDQLAFSQRCAATRVKSWT